MTVRQNTLKKEMKTWEVESPSSTSARNVVSPPLNTADPIVDRAEIVRLLRSPAANIFFYVLSNILRDICFVTFRNNECVADVHGVVHAEPHGEHDVDAADDVDSDAPEVEEAHDVDEGEEDGEEDEGGDAEVGEQHHDHGEDGGQRQPDVAPQLVPDNLVRLPGRVHLPTMLFTQLQTKVQEDFTIDNHEDGTFNQ